MGGATGRLAEVGGLELKFLAGAAPPVEVLVLLDTVPPDLASNKEFKVHNCADYVVANSPALHLDSNWCGLVFKAYMETGF